MAFIFSTSKYSTSVTTSNWIASGHDGTDAMILGGSGKLILSASNGITHLSGALDIGLVPDNKAYHVRSIGGPLILSSSGGGSFVYASGNLTVAEALLVKGDTVLSGNVVVGGQLYDLNSNLILSSSVGSVIAASGSLDFPNSDKTYHIRSVNDKLILSSSAGSAVYISGNLQASGSHTLTGTLNLFDGLDARGLGSYHLRSVNDKLILSSSAGSAVYISGNLQASGSHTFTGSVGLLDAVDSYGVASYHIRAVNSHLILSSSAGSVVVLSSSQDFSNTDKSYHIRSVNGKLILSSSAGSAVYISGNFQASGSHTFTGSLNLFDGIDEQSLGAYHLRSVNDKLILSSSAGSAIYISGNFQASGSHTLTGSLNLFDGIDERSVGSYHLRAVNSHLILSSSAGSIVAFSASQDFTEADKVYHLRAVNSHLILSGTQFTFSGSMIVLSTGSGPALLDKTPTSAIPTIVPFRGSAGGLITGIGSNANNNSPSLEFITNGGVKLAISTAGAITTNSEAVTFVNRGIFYNDIRHLTLSSTVGSLIAVCGSLVFPQANPSPNAAHVIARNSHLILSSTVGSVVSLSSNLYFPVDAPANLAHVTANNSHLTLSSSAGYVVTASGSIRSTGYASASMPSPSGSVPSGTIAYVSDLGFLAIAWNGAWQRLSTGSW